MKKLFAAILIVLFAASVSFAAVGTTTVTATATKSIVTGKTEFVTISVAFTASATDGTVPDTTLTNYMDYIRGLYLVYVRTDGNHSGTEPQEDSEVYVYIDSIDALDGDGVDALDNTAERTIDAECAGVAGKAYPICSGQTVTVTITQQAAVVNSATGTVDLIFGVRP